MSRKSSKLMQIAASAGRDLAEEPERDKAFVNVVAKAFELLLAFDGAQARLGNQEMARLTGLPKATVARLAYTMTRLGYLTYLPDDCAYKLGEKAIALSGSILRGMDFRFSIRPYMQQLADAASASCGMSIHDGHHVVYLEHCRCDLPVTLKHSFGSRIPLLTSAAGRAYLAAIREDERERLFAEFDKVPPPGWPEVKPRILEAIAFFRVHGFVTVFGEWIENINGIAAPIWSPRHSSWFMFNCGGLTSLLTPEIIHNEIAPKLLAMLRKVDDILRASDQDDFRAAIGNLHLKSGFPRGDGPT